MNKTTYCAAASRAALALVLVAALTTAGRAGSNDGEIHIEPVRGNIYMLVGAGGNITLSVGPEGVLMVDTGVEEMSDQVLAAIERIVAAKQLTHQRDPAAPPLPIRYIVNTSVNPVHIGGNARIAQSSLFDPVRGGEEIISHGNVLNRMSAEAAGYRAGMPTDSYFTEYYKINRFFNGEGVQLFHVPTAHTDGDSIVWFRGADVISAGNLLAPSRYPEIDLERGGSVQGIIDGLNFLLDLMFAEFRGQGGTLVIPAQGRLSYANDVAYYRDMVTIVRDRIQHLIDQGMTLEQVRAAEPLLDYDTKYGGEPGATDRFIAAVYRSLTE